VSRIITYTRLSVTKTDKDGTPVHDGPVHATQAEQVAAWAAQHGHEVVDVISDDGVSGSTSALKRHGFGFALAALKYGRADRIVVLENGTISDMGAHEDLMKKLGTYRRLYDLQFLEVDHPRAAPVGD